MLKHSTRRWLTGLSVAGVLVAASPAPAIADTPPFTVGAPNQLVAPGHSTHGWLMAPPTRDDEDQWKFGRTTLDVDLSEVEDFATVEPMPDGWACEASSSKLHCEIDIPERQYPRFDYTLTGKDDATPGQQGDLTVTVTSGGVSATGTARITIAEGADLVSDEAVEISGAPRSRVDLPGVVHNGSATTVNGVVLMLQASWLVKYAGDYSNCASLNGLNAVCTFDTQLEANKSYQLSEDLPLVVTDQARTGAGLPVTLDWWTKDDWTLIYRDWPIPGLEPGHGGELRLLEQTGAKAKAQQTDVDRTNNFTLATIHVTGDNPADLAAKGATASGKKGDVVTVLPSFTNFGPAALEIQIEKLPVRITIPQGTTAVEASGDCVPYVPGEEWDPENAEWAEPGAREYACLASEIAVGGEHPYVFALRIDEVVPDATGTFAVKLDGDPKAQNDSAKIIINPTRNGGGDGGQGGGDDGPTLPITGAPTGLITAVGGLLLVAGTVGYLVARRRKTRFVA
ncbi:LPXTG cell wall anchor domain-containing protein [Micromonospora sp. NPDC048930]|uniref:LPXTG cell wall anchor domain-containing protein n=1 Tax=Micromonospora sp. NPDC048930 TaxID=3364261 RepID=UPI003712803E